MVDLEHDINIEISFFQAILMNNPNYGDVPDEKLPNGQLLASLEKLIGKITELKEEHVFYDQEAEYDRMFPDRHDDDFDDDDMSFRSLFGDD